MTRRFCSATWLAAGCSTSGSFSSGASSVTMLFTSKKNTISKNTTSISGVIFSDGLTAPRWVTCDMKGYVPIGG